MSKSRVWKPSSSPRTRNSACPCSPGLKLRDVVARCPARRPAPGPRRASSSGWSDRLAVTGDLGALQRVVAWSGCRPPPSGSVIVPRDVADDEVRAHGRAVGDEELRGEELLQIADVAGDDEEAGDPDRLSLREW